MAFQPGAMVYTQAFGSRPESVEVPHLDVRAPTTADTGGGFFAVGKRWINTVGNAEYVLTSLTTTNNTPSATWTLLGTNSGALNTLTGDAGGAIAPAAGNITLAGTAGQISTSGAGSTITFALAATLIAPGSLEVTGLLKGDAGATLNTAGTAMNIATDADAAAVNIATVGARTTTIGTTTGAAGIAVNVGTGNFLLSGATGSTITIGTGLTTGTILIGGAAETGTITLGSSSGTNAVAIGAGAGVTTVNIANGVSGNTVAVLNGVNTSAQTMNIASGTSATGASTVNILNGVTPGASTTLNIMNGAATAGTQAVNILSTGATRAGTVSIGNGAAAHTCIFGSTNTTATTTVNAGTGGLKLTGGQVLPVTNVNNAATPYALLGTDQFVAVDPTAGVVSITLPAAPATGRFITVYDATGQAAAHTITVDGNGKNISAAGTSAATKTLTTAFQSMNLWYNGTIWNAQIIT